MQEMFERCMTADIENCRNSIGSMTVRQCGIIINPGTLYKWIKRPTWPRDHAGKPALPVDLFEIVLRRVCLRKNVDQMVILSAAPRRLISRIYGAKEKCFRCNKVRGSELYGRPNWHLLDGVVGFTTLRDGLPGMLEKNHGENKILSEFLYNQKNFDWSTFTEEIFDTNMLMENGVVWDKEQWYCTACITTLLTTRFPYWYIARQEGNTSLPPKEDCRDGWDCLAQRSSKHARKFNHFREPVRDNLGEA